MWKQQLLTFANRFEHPAWGVPHFQRVYDLTLELAREGSYQVDRDAVFAAAYLHDIGAFEPYIRPGIDHAEQSVQVVGEILAPLGFPSEKVSLVKEIIKGHMFYVSPTSHAEALIFHDADTLEFMGTIGVTRILSIVGLDDWTPDLRSAVDLIRRFSEELPGKLHTPQAQQMGEDRQAEMEAFLITLSGETDNLNVL